MQLGRRASLPRTPANNIAQSVQDSAGKHYITGMTGCMRIRGKAILGALLSFCIMLGPLLSNETGLEFGRRVAQLWNWTSFVEMFYQNALARKENYVIFFCCL